MTVSKATSVENFRQAVGLYQAGRLGEAEAACRAILAADSGFVDAMHLLAVVLAQSDRADEGAGFAVRAMKLGGENPAAWNNLGEIRRMQGQYAEAESCYRNALRIAPRFAEAHYGLGNILKHLGRDEDAVYAYRAALDLAPGFAKARFNLANTLRDQGRVPAAIEEYRRVLADQPNWGDAHLNLGNALADVGDLDQALLHYELARAGRANDPDLDANIGDTHLRQGEIEKAKQAYGRSLERRPANWLRRLKRDALCELIPPSLDYIDNYRAGLERALAQYRAEPLVLDPQDLASSGAEPPMLLSYQGRDDRPLRSAFAELFRPLIGEHEPPAAKGKPKVGIVVTKGHEGVFGRCQAPLIERLDRSKLDVYVVCSLAGKNILSHLFFRSPQQYIVLPRGVPEAVEVVRQARLDLLHYWEIGTDSLNYFLPFYRPARVQTTTWGWPVTTGNPAVDVFISSQGIEPPGADAHYIERLVTLPGEPTYYERPPVGPATVRRADYGLAPATRYYACFQNLRKCHPDLDPILGDILRRDPEGEVLLLADEQEKVTARLMARLNRGMPDVVARVRVWPRMERADYLNVLALADVCLDTPHYGGGANTVCDALATGTPMITLPGAFHRGRYAAAEFERLGLEELVASAAEDYAQRAVAIAGEPDRRRDLSTRMRERGAAAFEDRTIVAAYQELFLELIEGSRR